jgi:hypothetical protein
MTLMNSLVRETIWGIGFVVVSTFWNILCNWRETLA